MSVLDGYLEGVGNLLKTKNANELQQWLRVEPSESLPASFYQLALELKTSYPDDKVLDTYIEKMLPENFEAEQEGIGTAWPGFRAFMMVYLGYWRNVDFDDLLGTHALLSSLTNSCVTALSNTTYGILILPASIQICQALATLAMTLDKRPDLTRKLRNVAWFDAGENSKTVVETTAELIQRAFTMCLTERSTNRNGTKDGKPEGKKIGIYLFANLVLKMLFQCRKTRLANQLFTNISQHSPQLSLYPANQRVTYLYYLGRYHFHNMFHYRAQLCLQAAYDQCAVRFVKHRRLILIYLIPSNMVLGRFPSPALLARPEAQGLADKFIPTSNAIKRGNFIEFKQSLDKDLRNTQWLFDRKVYLAMLYRCEPIVWRSLARRCFLLTYQAPTDLNSKKAPTLDINALVTAACYCQKVLGGWTRPVDPTINPQNGRAPHTNAIFMKVPNLNPPEKEKKLAVHEGVFCWNRMPTLHFVEMTCASLVQQGFLHGYLSHAQAKFAIVGSKQRGGPLNAGFPNPWEVIKGKAVAEGQDDEVPGWVRKEKTGGMGGVVNLSGIARPVGSGG